MSCTSGDPELRAETGTALAVSIASAFVVALPFNAVARLAIRGPARMDKCRMDCRWKRDLPRAGGVRRALALGVPVVSRGQPSRADAAGRGPFHPPPRRPQMEPEADGAWRRPGKSAACFAQASTSPSRNLDWRSSNPCPRSPYQSPRAPPMSPGTTCSSGCSAHSSRASRYCLGPSGPRTRKPRRSADHSWVERTFWRTVLAFGAFAAALAVVAWQSHSAAFWLWVGPIRRTSCRGRSPSSSPPGASCRWPRSPPFSTSWGLAASASWPGPATPGLLSDRGFALFWGARGGTVHGVLLSSDPQRSRITVLPPLAMGGLKGPPAPRRRRRRCGRESRHPKVQPPGRQRRLRPGCPGAPPEVSRLGDHPPHDAERGRALWRTAWAPGDHDLPQGRVQHVLPQAVGIGPVDLERPPQAPRRLPRLL
jgi:hypothetical protein